MLPPLWLKPKKGTIVIEIPLINSWISTQKGWHVFTRLCQCHLELERARRPSYFYHGYFHLSKSFNHITKDASTLCLKLGGSCRFSYFPTSTVSRHTSNHHGWPIASNWFLTWRNTMDLGQYMQLVFYTNRLWHLLWAYLMSYNFSLILFLIPLYIFQIYGVCL